MKQCGFDPALRGPGLRDDLPADGAEGRRPGAGERRIFSPRTDCRLVVLGAGRQADGGGARRRYQLTRQAGSSFARSTTRR